MLAMMVGCAVAQDAPDGGVWSGTWDVTGVWGKMTLVQKGDAVTGTYAGGGEITGTAAGNVLDGTWDPRNRKGPLRFTLSADMMSFDARWDYPGRAMTRADKGTRLTALPAAAAAAINAAVANVAAAEAKPDVVEAKPAAAAGPKTREEVAAALKNFSITLVFEAQGQAPYHLHQASCDKGVVAEMKGDRNSLSFVDLVAKKEYDLDPEAKTGEVDDLDPDDPIGGYLFFDGMILSHTFVHNSHKENLEKTGSEKVAGRDATVYNAIPDKDAKADTQLKIWLDDEYGFALKYVQTGGGKPLSMEVTEFKVGGVTIEDILKKVNLKDYKID